jgi:hypothetical protein
VEIRVSFLETDDLIFQSENPARIRRYDMPAVKKENYIPNYASLVAYAVKQFAFDVFSSIWVDSFEVHPVEELRGVLHNR